LRFGVIMLTRVRHWWKNGEARPVVPFEVACACGQLVCGQRLARHQVVRCGGCGRPVFVLPASPLSPQGAALQKSACPVAETARFSWRGPALGALVTLAIVVGGFVLWLPHLLRWSEETPNLDSDPTAAIRAEVRAGQQALAAGNFQQALEKFEAGRLLRQQETGLLPGPESRALDQLHRQAALLADGSNDSLQEMLRQAAGLDPREWQILFSKRYQGKAVIFDGWLRRDAAGQVQLLDYQVFVKDEQARLEWQDLQLLPSLPLQEPHRLLFGARLASVRREDRAEWVIRFEPASGVLLTDPGAAAAACLQPLDEGLEEVLRRQAGWVNGEY
jgi:hypothetical protein